MLRLSKVSYTNSVDTRGFACTVVYNIDALLSHEILSLGGLYITWLAQVVYWISDSTLNPDTIQMFYPLQSNVVHVNLKDVAWLSRSIYVAVSLEEAVLVMTVLAVTWLSLRKLVVWKNAVTT